MPFVMATGLAMAEQFSAYPVNGGVYSWCYLLSSKEWGPCMYTCFFFKKKKLYINSLN